MGMYVAFPPFPFCSGVRGDKEGDPWAMISLVVMVTSLSGNSHFPFLSTCNSDAAYQWCPGEWPLCADHHCCLC